MKTKIKDCPFCDNDISKAVYMRSENFLVIYNRAPILPGHSLVIPKTHIESLLELTTEELFEFILLSTNAAKQILKIFHADSFNWTVQEKQAAGQTISHLHLHVFPRHDYDLPNPGDWYPILKATEYESQYVDSGKRIKLTEEELTIVIDNLRRQINQTK